MTTFDPRPNIAAGQCFRAMRVSRGLAIEGLAERITYRSTLGHRYDWAGLIMSMEHGEMGANQVLWSAVAKALHRFRPFTSSELLEWRRQVCRIPQDAPSLPRR